MFGKATVRGRERESTAMRYSQPSTKCSRVLRGFLGPLLNLFLFFRPYRRGASVTHVRSIGNTRVLGPINSYRDLVCRGAKLLI